MKKSIIALFLFATIYANAQDANIPMLQRPEGRGWYISGTAGYGIPFLTSNMRSPFAEVGDKLYFNIAGEKSIRPQYKTNGAGIFGAIAFGHWFNKHLGIETQFMMVNHPEVTDAEIKTKNYSAYQRTHTIAWYLSPSIMYNERFKKFGITTKIGPFIPIGGIVTSNAQIVDNEGKLMFSLLNFPIRDLPPGILTSTFGGIAKTKLVPTIGLKAAISLEYYFKDKYCLFFEANAGVYNIKIKETVFESQKVTASLLGIQISNLGIDELPTYLKHYVWVDEITETSNNLKYHYKPFDPNKPMEDLTQKLNASTMYFGIGMKVNINRWDDYRGPKKSEKVYNKQQKRAAKKS